MRILIVSSTCSASKYKEIYEKRYKPMLDTNQKFFLSLIEGLNSNRDIIVDCISKLPVSHRCYPDIIIKHSQEVVNGISYKYSGCINYPIIQTITNMHSMHALVKMYLLRHKNEKIIVLCDGLIAEANALVRLLKKEQVLSVALVTDIPSIVSDMSSGKGLKTFLTKIYGKYATNLLQSFDRYVLLTEQMNEICNPNNKPYMIMECIVTPIKLGKGNGKRLADKPVVLYAGKLHSDFGSLQLAKAAVLLQDVCEIWLYGGHSNCQNELNEIESDTPNLKIHDIVELNEIMELEQRADVLINPRPNCKSFTKYSFPSKTAEYMMMGVPVIMNRLDGVPNEYDKYLIYLEGDTPEAIAKKIRYVLSMRKEEQHEIGFKARNFIIKEKNNVQQARMLLKFFDFE